MVRFETSPHLSRGVIQSFRQSFLVYLFMQGGVGSVFTLGNRKFLTVTLGPARNAETSSLHHRVTSSSRQFLLSTFDRGYLCPIEPQTCLLKAFGLAGVHNPTYRESYCGELR